MSGADLEVLNLASTDPSKIYRSADGKIFRFVSSLISEIIQSNPDFFLFEAIEGERVIVKKANFHINVSCWCSAQVRDYLRLSEMMQNKLISQNANLVDGHPWNFVFQHGEIKFIDFGSIKEGPPPSDWFWTERAESVPLEKFFYASYCGKLRRRLAENVHEPAPIPNEDIFALGFQGLADRDCHTPFRERLIACSMCQEKRAVANGSAIVRRVETSIRWLPRILAPQCCVTSCWATRHFSGFSTSDPTTVFIPAFLPA